jgi:outer membrane translocation and assembly module TamA
MGGDINAAKKNTGAVLDTSKEVGLEVNTEWTKNVYMSHHHNVRENHDIQLIWNRNNSNK